MATYSIRHESRYQIGVVHWQAKGGPYRDVPYSNIRHGKTATSWWDTSAPATFVSSTTTTYVGIVFWITVPGRIAGFRAYIDSTEDGNTRGFLWTPEPITQRTGGWGVRANVGTTAWHQVWLPKWYRPPLNTDLRLAVLYPHGKYYRTVNALTPSPVTHNGIQFRQGFQTTSLVPEQATLTNVVNANGVDILFYPD